MSSIRRSEGANIDALLKAAEILEEKLYSHSHYDLRESSETGHDRCSNISQLKLNSLKDWFTSGDLSKMDPTVTDHVGPQLRVDLASILKMTTQPRLEELQLIRDATEKLKKTSALDPLAFANADLLFNSHSLVGPNNNARDLGHHHRNTPTTTNSPWMRCSTRLGQSAPNSHLGNFNSNASELYHRHHQTRVITAASGLGHLVSSASPGTVPPSEDEPDTVSNASEDLGLDNSSQDSFPGSSLVNQTPNSNLALNSDMIIRQARSNQSSSNCRLRTALLNSTCLKNLEQQNGFDQTIDKPASQLRQHHQRTNSPSSRTSLVVSRKSCCSPTNLKSGICTANSPVDRKSPDSQLQLPSLAGSQTLRKCKSFSVRPQEFSSWSAPPSVASTSCVTPDKDLADSLSFVPLSIPTELSPNQNQSHIPNRPGRLSCSSLPVKKRKLDWKQQQSCDGSIESTIMTTTATSVANDSLGYNHHHHQPSSAPPLSSHAGNLFKIGVTESANGACPSSVAYGSLSSEVCFSIGECSTDWDRSRVADVSQTTVTTTSDQQEDPICRRPHSIPAPLMNGVTAFHETSDALPERRISYQFRHQSSSNSEYGLVTNHSPESNSVQTSLIKPWEFKSSVSTPKYQSHSSVLARTLEASVQSNPPTSTPMEFQSLQDHLDSKPIRLWVDTRPDGISIRENRNLSTGCLAGNSTPKRSNQQQLSAPRSPNYYSMNSQQRKLNLPVSHQQQSQHSYVTKYMPADHTGDSRSYGLNRSLSLTSPSSPISHSLSGTVTERSLPAVAGGGGGGLIQDRRASTVVPTAVTPTTLTITSNGGGLTASATHSDTFSDLINSMISKQSMKEYGDSSREPKFEQAKSHSFTQLAQSDCLNSIRKLSNKVMTGSQSDQHILSTDSVTTAEININNFNDFDKRDSNVSLISRLSASGAARGAQVIMMLAPSEDSNSSQTPNGTNSSPTQSASAVLTPTSNLNYSLVQGLTVANRTTNGTSSFPLLLVSASSSASAAAMAAAAALATGAPPTSLVPVPVQVTTYVPPTLDQTNSTSNSNLSINVTDQNSSTNQRFILSVLPSDKSSDPGSDRKIPLILSAPQFAQPNREEPSASARSSQILPTPPALKCVPIYQPTKAAHPAA